MLFNCETPLNEKVQGTSTFAKDIGNEGRVTRWVDILAATKSEFAAKAWPTLPMDTSRSVDRVAEMCQHPPMLASLMSPPGTAFRDRPILS